MVLELTMTRSSNVRLEWVIDNGMDKHVSEYGGLSPRERPVVYCPECNERLILRLGKKRAWHAAHQKDAKSCVLTQPESALHYNTKMFLAEQLKIASMVVVTEACKGHLGYKSNDCKESNTVQWISNWEDVVVERNVHHLRPDISLKRNGKTIGCVEVKVTHAVGEEKIKCFSDLELDWIEVEATSDLIHGDNQWRPCKPLSVMNMGPEAYTCRECIEFAKHEIEQEKIRKEEEKLYLEKLKKRRERRLRKKRQLQAIENEKQRDFQKKAIQFLQIMKHNGVSFERLKVFDVYFSNGAVQRVVFVIAQVYKEGELLGAFLGRANDFSVLKKVSATEGADGYYKLNRFLEKWFETQQRELKKNGGAICSSDGWFKFLKILDDSDFRQYWFTNGKDCILDKKSIPPPWIPDFSNDAVNCCDLLAFYLDNYLLGLPFRYRWSNKNMCWFQPKLLGEISWKLWPYEL